MSLADRLRETTAQAHQRAEHSDLQRQLVRGKLADQPLALYLHQLRALHRTLEQCADQLPSAHRALLRFSDPPHSAHLDEDLAALDPLHHHLPLLPATRRLIEAINEGAANDPAAVAGFNYVLEGSMNGNRFIIRALRKSVASERCAFSYFDPYGEEQPQRWAQFKVQLDALDLNAEQADFAVDAAMRMFDGITAISAEVLDASAPQPA